MNVDPKLGPLQSNGGRADAGSDAGQPRDRRWSLDSPPTFDQRGLARVVNDAIDIGAVELQDSSPDGDPGDGYAIQEGDPLTVNASDSADPEGEGLCFSWDINGDGMFGDATGPNPTLAWSQLSALGITGRAVPYNVSVRVDDGFGGSHAVTSNAVDLTVSPRLHIISISSPTPGPLDVPLDSIEVQFSGPIDPATITSSAISLSMNGSPILRRDRSPWALCRARRPRIGSPASRAGTPLREPTA